MSRLLICLVLVTLSVSVSNTTKTLRPLNPENKMFIITLDGFRWQELFNGADSALVHDPSMNIDTSISKAMYWSDKKEERRKKLLPFFWNVIASQGELWGNRALGNNVNVSNPYALSYPGYNEILTGRVDYSIWDNEKRRNRNKNILQVLNDSSAYAGKVAAFTSWELFPYILDKEHRGSFVLNSGLQNVEGRELSPAQERLNEVQGHMHDEGSTRYDELTYIACKEYILKNKPSVVFLSFSGTDNAGHSNHYDQYLQEANNADRMIGELWRLIQTLPEYAGKTTLMITTDHGRGKGKAGWSEHGFFIPGSSQTWYALLGNTIVPHGEMTSRTQVYQKQLNGLVMDILSRK